MKKFISVFAVCLFAAPFAYAAMHVQGTNQTSASAACCECCTDCKFQNCVCSELGCACDGGGDCACDAGCCASGSCCAGDTCCVK